MDQLQTRLDALEQQMHTVNHRLRWWRGLAVGLVVLAVLTWALPSGTAQEDAADKGPRGLAQRMAALESLLTHFSREGNDVTLKGANLHLVNGLGRTDCGSEEEPIPDCPNGLGNLIVGYNEPRDEETFGPNIRTGSHNVVVGREHNFSRFGGLVVGLLNTISGDFAVVSGGSRNTASELGAVVTGGIGNTASSFFSSVSGGQGNTASSERASISGGEANTASGFGATVSGGVSNTASGTDSSVSGGQGNTASDPAAVVSGGVANMASGYASSVSGGGGFQEGEGNTAGGDFSSVTGGIGNTASGQNAVVSGGQNITQATEHGWSAGSEGDEVVVGNFRSP
jgi:hypothetical protein